MRCKIFSEAVNSRGILAVGDIDDFTLVEINNNSDILMALLAGFVNADGGYARVIFAATCFVNVILDKALETGVMLIYHVSNSSDRKVFGKLHNPTFEEQSETGAFSGPRHADSFYAMLAAPHPWQVGMDIGFVLEEVKVAPSSGRRIVGSSFRPAFRAGKLTASRKGELYMKFHSSG